MLFVLCKKKLIQDLFLCFVWSHNTHLPKYKFHHQKHSSKKLHKHYDRVQFKEKADIDVWMWLPVKSVSMTRVIQWTLFSGLALWRVTMTILARWMIVYPVIAGHVTAPESGPEIREWEMVGVTRRRRSDTRSTSSTELRPERSETGAWHKHRLIPYTRNKRTPACLEQICIIRIIAVY